MSISYNKNRSNIMFFNNEKFELLRCGKEKDIIQHTSLHTTINPIQSSSHVKCLGIHLSDDGTFHHHIHQTTKKARRLAGWILRTFHTREASCLLTLWKGLLLDYYGYHIKLQMSRLWRQSSDPSLHTSGRPKD